MAKPMMNLFSNLEHEFETVQKSLSDIDASIRKVTGKDPSRAFENNSKPVRSRLRSINNEAPRRFGTLKRRLADPEEKEDESNKRRSLQSQVVATSWETKQRNQVLEEQKNDTKSLNRNKRMFGLLMGTLEKFKSEESQRKDTKREEIEQKLDKADEQEREAIKKERAELFQQRKERRAQLKCLQEKMQRAEVHKEWERAQQSLGSFIETKTKPCIFYMPVKHNSDTLKRLQETKDKYRMIFAEKRAKIQKELNDIDERFRKEYNIEPGDFKPHENNKIAEGNSKNDPEETVNNKLESSTISADIDADETQLSDSMSGEKSPKRTTDESVSEKADHCNLQKSPKDTSDSVNGKENESLIKEEEDEAGLTSNGDFEPMYE